jgi:hypothetical protein
MKTISYTKIIRICLITFALSGCVTTAPITLPDGSQGRVIRCDGAVLNISDCAVKAGRVCPLGYDVEGAGEDSHGMFGGSSSAFFGGDAITRSMIVRCHRG